MLPGTTSPAYFAAPVTFSRPSRRLADVPTTVYDLSGLSGVLPSALRSIRLPSVNCPYVTVFLGSAVSLTMPAFTASRSTGTCSRSAAICSSSARASAAPWRSTGPNCRTLSEPNVPMSQGHRSVSPMTMSTTSSDTSSSSASSCGSDVITPWPSSILPTKQVTLPSAPTCR